MKHLAIIMDGNRRWGKLHGKDGHKEGAKSIMQAIEGAMDLGIEYLSVYAFSSENWQRPVKEIASIMKVATSWLEKNLEYMREKQIRCRIIGDRNILPFGFLQKAQEVEKETENYQKLSFQIACSYGGRDELLRACMKVVNFLHKSKKHLNEKIFNSFLDTKDIPDPDLLIRTGGEKRLSNYMLWQMAYTELYFIDKFWPDFTKDDLKEAYDHYSKRERRFGSL